MATGVQVFTSNDSSAPQLYGAAGSLVGMLDACLVNGYGAKSAAGTGGSGVWTISYTGTNRRVYRPAAGNQFYLRVRDDAGGTGGAQEAQIKGAESFSDVNTATNPMPTTGQSTLTDNSLIVRKSATADGVTGRPWIVLADDRTVYMFINTGDTANTYYGWMWGDFYGAKTSDGYRTMIIGRAVENSSAANSERLDSFNDSNAQSVTGNFLQRTYAGTGTAITMNKQPFVYQGSGSSKAVGGNGLVVYPNGADSALYLTPVFVNETTQVVRGRMRGFWNSCHTVASLNDGDTFSGTGDLTGRTFRIIKSSGNSGLYVVETSDTWDTSS